ncbi:MAG TPA: bifunctional [glutamine synthetase] adenylyltransferase/[glutamine synthetase]-adenylyl-L-tyrosine phosphorylase, partial [Xanthobacteraceae bacterium]|nr:bifunctional [glutamine synthetase] adenylyltransferase/[glutamine synthetase]-adenylyl-L-tyrosine phosphorylase [Xanthobacteraceae bacterium]
GAVRFLLRDAVARGKLEPRNPAQPEQGSGYVVVAMGKMGAFELNYSSDIDLIVFFDPDAPSLNRDADAGQLYVRVTRGLVKLLQERTADGYVFRVDLRLRPDPASTQVAVSLQSALSYYESVGRNWERAAMIKARACAGDTPTGEALLNELVPFIWRKYLDFASITDVQAMKQQIHAYKGHGEIAIEGHNLKLGRGGIREIEFFVQTQQLIAGGRHPQLRGRSTLAMLNVLAEGGWISAEARDDMAAAYDFLRKAEHRLQMVADEQTQTLPADREGTERFARFLGFNNRDDFAAVLAVHLRNVQRHYEQLFEAAPAAGGEERGFAFPKDKDDAATLDNLSALGFRNPLQVSEGVRHWLSGSYRTLKSETAREHLTALVPLLLRSIAKTENRETVFVAFDHFLTELHAGSRLFSLLRQNPDLVGFMVLILGTAPRLADILARYPHVIDPLLEPGFFGSLPDEAKLRAEWERAIGQTTSYEDFLDRIRMFGQEQMFLIGARILSQTVSAGQAGEAFANLADVMIRALDRAVQDNFAQTHGRVPGQETALLALGKLGGREMTASSDLDLIMVYDFDADAPQSDGPRPLYGSQYFARLTQRLISALTVQTNYGVLYPVDMRLRPSGRSGPLATQLAGFESYQEQEAWTWEHLALTRARIVSASSPQFESRVADVIRTALSRRRESAAVAGDVVEMRRAIATEKGDSDRWDLKFAAGGLIDLEFIAQYLQLVHAADHPGILHTSTARVLDKAWQLGLLPAAEAEVLRPAVRLYQNLTQILRLCLPGAFDPKTAGAGLLRLLVRAGDVPDFATLDAHVAETEDKVRQSFVRILGEAP